MDINKFNITNFKKNYNLGKKQIIYHTLSADIHTPVSIIMKLKNEKYSFLYESVEKGSQKGRYSIIGLKPDLIWKCKDKKCTTLNLTKNKKSCTFEKNPLRSLKKLIKENKAIIPKVLPSISSGLYGFLGYEMIQYFESLELNKVDNLNLPESVFIRPSLTLVFDNVSDKLFITKLIVPSIEKALVSYENGLEEIHKLINKVRKPLIAKPSKKKNTAKLNILKDVKSNTSYKEFEQMVNKAKNYIYEGEIFQVVISRIFQKNIDVEPLSIYRALRNLNPSPYLFFINFNEFKIVGASPEILIKLQDKKVTIRPIAGTRRRGSNTKEDKKNENDLLSDPKEISEHLMLLDLGRNDISRVTKPGTVKVTDKMYIEYFSHVMHIVSNIDGELDKNKGTTDVLFSGFPAGTVTGAPKIRAIEIIEELEKSRRNIYAGSVGYISFNGDIDTCIALRTALIKNNQIYIQSGAGIVADSKPKNEYAETENKALALLTACAYAYNFE